MDKKYLDILTNIIGAVETGGQIYGKRRYDAYVGPNSNTSKEQTCTLGWGGNYGERARKLCKMIFDQDPAAFRKADNAGIEKKLSVNWETTKWHPTTVQKKALIAIITTTIGKKCQDELFQELMETYIAKAEEYGIKDVPAQMMWCEIQHLGGINPVKRIFGRAQKPYTPDTVFASLILDQKDAKSNTQVGDKIFQSRHECCVKWIKQYVVNAGEKKEGKNMAVTITLAGHGSGRPSKKDMNTYCRGRQKKGKGLVEVLRLPMTDAQRKKMHDAYKEILGRNYYNQNLRAYCYKAYKDGKYYSDCSSSIGLTAQKAGVSGVGLFNTAEMHKHWPKVKNVVIVNGIIQNPEVLKVGDALMFRGSDPTRPLGIGHTEMVYEIHKTDTGSGTVTQTTPTASSKNTESNVKKGQKWLNKNYGETIKKHCGALLGEDGAYGTKSRAAAICVWKDLCNRKHGAKLDPSNSNFLDSCKKAAKNATIKKGSSGTFVYLIEFVLAAKGFYFGAMDAEFGSGLYAAVKSFQKERGLTVDGVVGPDTWYALFN